MTSFALGRICLRVASRPGVLDADAFAAAQRLEELQRRVGLNISNSSKPPSTDGPARPRQRSLQRPSGKRPGGQAGQEGTTLRQRENPDVVRNHVPGNCSRCRAPLSVADSQGRGTEAPPGVRPARASSAGSHRAPCAQLLLRGLRGIDPCALAGGGGRSGAVPCALGRHRGLPAECPVLA